jgi:hypothetical protein
LRGFLNKKSQKGSLHDAFSKLSLRKKFIFSQASFSPIQHATIYILRIGASGYRHTGTLSPTELLLFLSGIGALFEHLCCAHPACVRDILASAKQACTLT